RQIAAKLGGLQVDMSNVVLSLVDRGIQFQLTDVRVRDVDGQVVAQAPMAAMQIDRAALLSARLSPTGIVLIRPRMRLAYAEQGGLSLSFGRSVTRDGMGRGGATAQNSVARFGAAAVAQAAEPAVAGQAAEPAVAGQAGEGRPITVSRSLVDLLNQVRTDGKSGGSLDTIGVRNALIELEHDGRVSRWGVPSGDLAIRHSDKSSVVSGLATIADAQGQNFNLAFHAESEAKTRNVALRTTISDLDAGVIARLSPKFAALEQLNAPMTAEGLFSVSANGELADGRFTVEVGPGTADVSTVEGVPPVQIDNARIVFRVDSQKSRIVFEPSLLRWGGGNELWLTGEVLRSPALDGDWHFHLKSDRGSFVAAPGDPTLQPVRQFLVRGHVQPSSGQVRIDEARVAAAGGSFAIEADLTTGEMFDVSISGRIGAGPVTALPYLWPATVAPDAREWVRREVRTGVIAGGEFTTSWSMPLGRSARRDDAAQRLKQSITLRGKDVEFASPVSRLPFRAGNLLVRVMDDQLEISAPTAEIQTGDNQSLALRQVNFTVAEMSVPESYGVLSFKGAGKLGDGIGLLAAGPWSTQVSPDLMQTLRSKGSGRVEGALRVSIPFHKVTNPAPLLTGDVQLRDVRVKDVIAGHNLSGGSFDLSIAPNSMNASGEMLLDGVATKLVWQYILDAPVENQPPVRLEANLDEADRDKLGLKINHIVRGLMDVEVNLIPLKGGGFASKVRADMTKSEIAVESLAWVKPTGRRTLLEFDVMPQPNQPLVLDNIRMVGDGVAVQGRAKLDASYNLREFELPMFSIDRVTRLELKGELQKDVWKVRVDGQTFEGRSLFRSLFQAGRIREVADVAPDQLMGIDLDARIQTVIGFWNTRLSDVRLTLSKRRGKMRAMQLEGRLPGKKLLKSAVVRGARNQYELHAFSDDAGEAFKLVGFYPNAHRGRLELVVDLDGEGAADMSGVLLVRNFQILGDELVTEMASAPRDGIQRRRIARNGQSGQSLSFDWMRVPFFIGNGQFILRGAELRGPVVGATIEGKADFGARRLDLSGTYVPLQGLNGALGIIPGLGKILAGPNGEGVLGMKFAVRGSMSE
ncbi:MAG: AsmA-like C-terminal region-containing protein, partial [Alphaproteobacteria bacterium]|nr:AsmA-like C-terminal region-containing protein [Alphaproteobacteria bacterium]